MEARRGRDAQRLDAQHDSAPGHVAWAGDAQLGYLVWNVLKPE